MTHFDMEHWKEVTPSKPLGVIRLKYAAVLSMIAFFVFAIIGLFSSFQVMLPFMTAAIVCWVVLGSASRKNRVIKNDWSEF